MNRHEGITCTVCRKTNFCGPRYKCLRCYNFDLCYVCYYQRVTSNQHTPDHPMQCIISDAHFELPSGGEPVARGYQAQSLVPQSSLPPISKDYVLPFDTFWPPERDGTVRTPSSLFRRSHERTGCLPASLLGVDLALLSGCGFWSLDTPNSTSPPPLNLLSAEPPLQNAANKPELDDEKFVESSIDSLAELSGSPLLPLTIPPPIPSTDHSDMTFTVLCPVREINSSSSSDIATDDSTEHLCSAHRHLNDSLSAESLVSRTSKACISEDYKLPFDTFWPPERDGTVRTPSSLFRRSHERTGCLPASLLGVDLALLSGCGFWSLDTPNTTSSPPLNLLSAEPPIQNAANEPELDGDEFVESSIDSLEQHPNEDRW